MNPLAMTAVHFVLLLAVIQLMGQKSTVLQEFLSEAELKNANDWSLFFSTFRRWNRDFRQCPENRIILKTPKTFSQFYLVGEDIDDRVSFYFKPYSQPKLTFQSKISGELSANLGPVFLYSGTRSNFGAFFDVTSSTGGARFPATKIANAFVGANCSRCAICCFLCCTAGVW